MADPASTLMNSGQLLESDGATLGQRVDFNIRGLGRRLPKAEAPEGWVKKIERSREGRVWVGFFHLWTTDVHGRRVPLGANIDETESAAIITEQGGQENHRERSQDGSSFCSQFA
jgi:hypothetical protein